MVDAEEKMTTSTYSPASEKQIAYLHSLVAERMPDVDPKYTEQVIAEGAARVSMAISRLLALPPVHTERKVNRYPSVCEKCDLRVEAEDGYLAKTDDGSWAVEHQICPSDIEYPFPYGRYAVDTEEGHLAFYVVTGKGIFVQASDILHKIKGKSMDSIVAKIAVDPKEASMRYGRELGQCGVCGRVLTDESSRQMGIGPVCAQKGWN